MRAALGIAVLGLCAATTLVASAEEESREGYVMPTACKSRDAEGGPQDHTKECALKPECVETGFGLLVERKFFEFDDEGDELAVKYFQTTERTAGHLVAVVGDFGGTEVRVKALKPIRR